MTFWLSLLFAVGFALIHLCSKYMRFVKDAPRSWFLSAAGGVAVSYVFMHLLPDLSHHQQDIERVLNRGIGEYVENHIYLLALLGLAMYYGLERLVKKSKKQQADKKASQGVFWLHMASFFLYNALIGYLLIREESGNGWGMFFYFLALSIHFITIDQSMRRDHRDVYDKYGRVLLAAAILIGWGTGAAMKVNSFFISVLVAFLAGSIILNVLKEELPEEKESSFGAFSIGLAGYTVLLMLM
ncbi:hypothetical protein [Ectobacillus ponti]|uniref:ZIP Zinc transporter n=1 Tax=Ectobacillus ponti TaxID=2961894 RepID=A0AA41X7M9_9BACI|nr:hypothetical protein [Ectobacillus ponti]MCP8967815.1 hypothetical protein [Ectobacillus ponti]